jgi:DNA-binding transcriptional MerR regulator
MTQLRMRDVCARTGLSRQAVHFYVEQGLVDPPEKTGRTMAYYTEAHVERILLVRRLQEEHFLPLKAIGAMLRDEQDGFTEAQRRVLADVKAQLSPATTMPSLGEATVPLGPLLERARVVAEDLAGLERLGFVTVTRRGGKRWVSEDDAWIVELWGEVRAAGFTRELGFGPELLAIFDDGIARIFEEEKKILGSLTERLPAGQLAPMVDRALPLVHAFLVRSHHRKLRALLASIGASPRPEQTR